MTTTPLTEDNPPRASVLAESLRAFGYDLGTAIADLVDNSVSAGAHNVWIDFRWEGADSSISITDDGAGMSEARLRDAMRLGSRHPGEKRGAHDLGRFGLGLKTSSFSQCRCLTVRTKEKGRPPVIRRWDLDHLARVDQWQVLLEAKPDSEKHFSRLENLTSGTCVLWQSMDRVVRGFEADRSGDRDLFLTRCEEVDRHLALVFHRMLENQARLKLFVNQHEVRPVDPFFISENTQELPVRHLHTQSGNVVVEPFVMPHESKLLDAEGQRQAGDPKDWTARQGFYIYRQDRLLVAGSWLGYRDWRKDEHHKLARIRVSLPNSSDEDWQIDVTKSRARPPQEVRHALRQIGDATRARARRVYSFRGERLLPNGAKGVHFVWEQMVRHGRTFYQINREHPAIAALLGIAERSREMETALQLIEESFPVALVAFQSREESESGSPFRVSDVSAIRTLLMQTWRALRASGRSPDEVHSLLALAEPFNQYPDLLQEIRETTLP